MGKYIVSLKHVTKIYGSGHTEVKAVDNVNFTVEVETMTAVVGPSGSGKSTLLHLIGAMDKATSGTLEIAGLMLNGLTERQLTKVRRDNIGFVFQTFNLIPNLSALENVTLPMEFVRLPRRKRIERGKQLLEDVELAHRMRHKPAELSGGEQQRVAIARALANNPDIVLADEPTGNLDSKTSERIFELLRKIAEHKTVIVVTHDLNLADYANRIVQINDGKIEEQ